MRASEYPIPDYACYVWHRGDGLMVSFPDGGTLFMPLSKLESDAQCNVKGCLTPKRELPPGWKWLLSTLAQRKVAYADERRTPKFGEPARPTSAQLQAALARTYARGPVRTTGKIDVDIFGEATEDTGQ
jgi:hypothetical protein